ncbi:MAG TPA: ABC transporter ATP-binding protein [Gemmataceae bacterium]|nr:ABC transporter ATP-binding protein [Gemmataceae bacterium]
MLLRTEHLTKDYGRFRALEDLNLEVAAGEVFGVLGPNGSGKSTALRLLLGFLRPTAGRALIAGRDCWSDGVAARRHVAYLPGELRLYENMTCRQLVRFLSRLRGLEVGAELDALAARFDLDLNRPIASLSSGMKRKAALLQVLHARAPLLIMDEPTNTLDPNMRDELLQQVREAREQGQAVVFSSHVLSEVEQVCDRVAVLRAGRLAHLQNMAELREGRLVRARLAEPWRPEALPDGLVVREHEKDRLTLEYRGPLPPLLTWLARQPLADLRLEPLGLAAVYYRYHGADE